jgi:endonuclease-8
MPEGDTLFRTAALLREALAGRTVSAARGGPGGVRLDRVVGDAVESVDAQGKHLLISFSGGLTHHTHLRMHGSWHRYRPGEAWRRSPARAVAVIEVPGAVAVCFDAPTVELLDTRAVAIHPSLVRLGPDLLAAESDLDDVLRRLRSPERATMAVGDALLDQTALAGLGNVYRSEICFIERVDPFRRVADLDDGTLRRLLHTGRRLLHANRLDPDRKTTPDLLGGEPGSGGPRARGGQRYVYGRTSRPCRRCGTPIRSRTSGDLARRVFWCSVCQGGPAQETPKKERSESPTGRRVAAVSAARPLPQSNR